MYNRSGPDMPMSPPNAAAMYAGAPSGYPPAGYPQGSYPGGHPQRPMHPHHRKLYNNLYIGTSCTYPLTFV